jgi:hypothetical protein
VGFCFSGQRNFSNKLAASRQDIAVSFRPESYHINPGSALKGDITNLPQQGNALRGESGFILTHAGTLATGQHNGRQLDSARIL